ncbi:hypothetical protein MMC30_000705 [Trapelia coarctata]|nr:hypothetical protein [Trapelia coarctata]
MAVAGRPSGEAVRILRLSKVQAELEGREDTQLTHWAIDRTEQGSWVGRGSPIQQLCFSEDNGQPGGMLAVRCSTVTTILQPIVRRRPVPPATAGRKKPPSKDFKPSLLDPYPIVDLPITLTGDAPHVDVTFNPWDQHQLALLDSNGRWSIWNIEKRSKRRTVWTVRAGFSGNLPAEEEDALDATSTSDSWGIILWVCSPTTILIAKRNTIVLQDTTTGIQQTLGHGLGLDEASEWIFDVKRNPRDSAQLFVLTSSCIFWLRVAVEEESSEGGARTHILLARRHFRSHEDRGLQISVSATIEVIIVVLYSRSSDLATVFTFALTSPMQLPQSISDPFVLPLSNMQREEASGATEPQIAAHGRIPSTLCMRPLTDPYPPRAGSEEPGEVLVPSAMPCYQFFVLYKDLGVSEQLDLLAGDGQNAQGEHLARMIQFNPAKISKPPVRKSFIVPDAFISDVEGGESENGDSSNEQARNTRRRKSSAAPREPWMFDLRWLATAIEDGRSTAAPRASSAELFVKIIADAMAGVDDQAPGVDVLLDLFTGLPMDNVDNASSLLQNLINGIDDGSIVPGTGSTDGIKSEHVQRMLPLSTPAISSVFQNMVDRDDNNVMILPTYETLLNLWISSLGSVVPGRTRVGLEKQVRKISIELYLSLHGLHHGPNAFAMNETAVSVRFSDKINLPFRRRRSAESLSRKSKARLRGSSPFRQPTAEGSQPRNLMLPTPEPTPSHASQPPESPSANIRQTPYDRLKTLVPLKSQPALSESLSKLVDQWEIGLDPGEYDWDNTQPYLSSQSEADGPDAEIIRRRRQRREKRLKRHHQESLGASTQSDSRNYFSSQPQVPQVPPSSQVTVPKVHGSSQFMVPVVRGSSPTTVPMVQGSQFEPDIPRGRPTKVKEFAMLGKRKPGFG